jgi:peptidoglycan/xylan/chitin deacetylase (PgdA/CDA1 family)
MIEMTQRASVVISLDFELRWGMQDRLRFDRNAYRENLENETHVAPQLLRLFLERQIRATWAVVGAIACRSWDEYFVRAPRPPRYQNPDLAISPRYAELDPDGRLHFGAGFVHAIHGTPGQELGTHTFSHILMREPGVTADDVRLDLHAVASLWRERFGAAPVSLVFPRNQIAFESVVRGCGIRIWRGTEGPWYFDRNEAGRMSPLSRGLRLFDAVNPYVRRASSVQGEVTRSSLFLRANLPRPAWVLHVARIRRELAALRPPQVFHLWWHPHNLGPQVRVRLGRVEQILDLIAGECARGRVVSRSMSQLLPGGTAPA